MDFVTLFDKTYLSRGLILYKSLKNTCQNGFTLYILAMDKETEDYLKINLKEQVVIISLDEIELEYDELNELKKERSWGEYCWTLSSYSIKYIFDRFDVPLCIYLDTDLLFCHDPSLLINEMGEASVLITEHNYTPEYDQSVTSGKFCVQFMCFRNNEQGLMILDWWREKCREWCFGRYEDGKFGDQKYLDDWESRFGSAVYNCRRIGCGVAPWNCQKYQLEEKKGSLLVNDKITKLSDELIFFHFHGITRLDEDQWIMSGYKLDEDFKNLYREYINQIREIEKDLPQDLQMPKKENPFQVKHKLRHSIKVARDAFVKEFFSKPLYMENIFRSGEE